MRFRSWLPLVSLIVSCASCASGPPEGHESTARASASVSPPKSRKELAAAMAKIAVGTPEAEVKRLLGAPDDVRRKSDPGGIATAGTREIWGYGAAAHLGFPTLGQIYIGEDG